MQEKFPDISNEFFTTQVNQLQSLLFDKLVMTSKMLNINDALLLPHNLERRKKLHPDAPRTMHPFDDGKEQEEQVEMVTKGGNKDSDEPAEDIRNVITD
jgi:hypothetical protein